MWLRAPKLSVIPATASATASATVSSSYLSATSQTFAWDLSDTAKAPYIGLQDTTSGSTMGSIMFFIESSAPAADSSAFQDGDTSVWINAGQRTCTSSKIWANTDNTTTTTSAC